MAINFSQGFNITAQEPVDARLVLTKEEMLNIKKARMPEKYFALCKDDGKIYVYDSSVEPSEETGRFKEHDLELQGKVQDALDAVEELNQKLIDEYVSKEELPDAIAVELPGALKKAMEEDPSTIEQAVAKTLPGAITEAMGSEETKKAMSEAVAKTLPSAIAEGMKQEPEAMSDAVSQVFPSALAKALEGQTDKDSGLTVDENGNIKVGVNEEQMEIIDNKIEIKLDDAIRLIEAIDGN